MHVCFRICVCIYRHMYMLTYVPVKFLKHDKNKKKVLLEIKLSVLLHSEWVFAGLFSIYSSLNGIFNYIWSIKNFFKKGKKKEDCRDAGWHQLSSLVSWCSGNEQSHPPHTLFFLFLAMGMSKFSSLNLQKAEPVEVGECIISWISLLGGPGVGMWEWLGLHSQIQGSERRMVGWNLPIAMVVRC